jgi:glucose/arabinose dehydrogenase
VCVPKQGYGVIERLDPRGGKREVYASGIRNTVGFDWDPRTKELWFTDNGRDMLGDDLPPDELNHAARAGLNFGFPYCHAGDLADRQFTQRSCREFTPPARKLGPHVAALGMRFYTGERFPEKYRGAIFIAEHGSWNRSKKIGYRVSVVRDLSAQPPTYETFAEGWLQGEASWGRPVDVIVASDGALLVSDDKAGAVYRIDYRR